MAQEVKLQVTQISAERDFESRAGNIVAQAGSAWVMRAHSFGGAYIEIQGNGPCPWRVNQTVIVTVSEEDR